MSKRGSLLLTILFAAAWYAAFQSRTSWIAPTCLADPVQCHPEQLNALDRSVLINYDAAADYWSFVTQDLSGALAVALAIILAIRMRRTWAFFAEVLVLLQASCANGFLNECIRLWVQRPRPFVYLDPTGQGGAPAHYTSFYSGHTSFAALAAACAWMTALRAGLPRPAVWAVASSGALLTLSTGALRVLAGRHFITDTLAGAFFGCLIAWAINRLHESRPAVR